VLAPVEGIVKELDCALGVVGGEGASALAVALLVEVALDGFGEGAGAADAGGEVAAGGVDAEGVERGGDARHDEGRSRIEAPRRGGAHLRHVAPGVVGAQREQLKQDEPQGVHVGGGADAVVLAHELFGRHVLGGAHEGALAGESGLEVGRGGEAAVGGGLVDDDAGEPPVEDVHLAEVAEHDVRGLEVAVQHAAAVRERHREARARERREELAPRIRRERVSGSPLRNIHSTSWNVTPRSRFIVKYIAPSGAMPKSYTGTMAGCSSCPCTRASRSKRRTTSGRVMWSGRMTLSATSRPMCRSLQTRTSPMPPRPRSSRMTVALVGGRRAPRRRRPPGCARRVGLHCGGRGSRRPGRGGVVVVPHRWRGRLHARRDLW
jgi:hypothetical protein